MTDEATFLLIGFFVGFICGIALVEILAGDL